MPDNTQDPCTDHCYSQFVGEFTDEQINQLVQLKRAFELAQADPDFANAFMTGELTRQQREHLQRIGVTIDIDTFAKEWNDQTLQNELIELGKDGGFCMSESVRQKLEQHPLVNLWFRYSIKKFHILSSVRSLEHRVPMDKKFDTWRLRRMAATKSELGHFGYIIDHPFFAFELGDGCSVGCWFCAFATKKLKHNLDYTTHKDFFRDIVTACTELFGKDPVGLSLLYYGTEPHDNPHYLDYVKDFKEITGHTVCTSTAVPDDPSFIRPLIQFYRENNLPWPRFSVLTKEMLFKIHELYTPDELRDIELLMQMKDHCRQKVTGGRIVKEHQGMRERDAESYMADIVPQGSIACVSGFLINMVQRTIEIVSPCYTTQKWKYGYRVFDKATFSDADDFTQAISSLIERNMPLNPPDEAIARFRDDLIYKPTQDGFDLVSPNQIHHFQGDNVIKVVGSVIAQGTHSYRSLSAELIDKYKINPILAGMSIKKLFDGGFLDELYNETGAEKGSRSQQKDPVSVSA